MPRWIALESDHRELRAVVARTRGKVLVIEEMLAIPAGARDESSESAGEGHSSPPGQAWSSAQALAKLVADHRLEKLPALIAIGRTSTELRQLTVPPAPADELPDMVRFQALRQFTNIGDDWPLDFTLLGGAAAETTNVLAAVISPATAKQIQHDVAAAALIPKSLVLRPFAAASLLRRQMPDNACRMVVDIVNDEADLTVLIADQVAFTRTVRLPADDGEALQRSLSGELRRTIVAAQNQLGGQKVAAIAICGDGDELRKLKSTLEEGLNLPVELFDPFSRLGDAVELLCQPPSPVAKFAPLLGMLLDEAANSPHDIDFLCPKRRPTPPNQTRRWALIGATAATIVLAIVGGIWMKLGALDSEIDLRRVELAKLNKKVAPAQKQQTELQAIEQFLDGDVAWLDEFYRISDKLPSADKVKLSQLQLAASPSPVDRGLLVLSGFASESAAVETVENSLRDPSHRIVSGKLRVEPREKTHPWEFETRVFVHAPKDATAQPSPPAAAKKGTKSPRDE